MINLVEKYGEWALITGASSGIGEEFAIQLAALGMKLILIARRKERLLALSSKLKEKYNTESVIISVDLTKENFLDEIKNLTNDKEIGILINNAGFGSTGEFINCDAVKEIEMIKVNCISPTMLTHYFLPYMIQRRRGAIIFLGSAVAFQPTPMMATYSATKAFNLFLGEALWWELKKYNIDVLALNPGGTNTEFQRIAKIGVGPVPREASDVVKTALQALGKKPSVVDGIQNKIVSVLVRFIPRRIAISLAGLVARSLYLKSNTQY